MKENRSLFDMKILEAYLGQRNSTGSFPWFDATACLIFLPSGLKRRTIWSLFMQMFLVFSLCVCCQKIYLKDYNTARKILLGTIKIFSYENHLFAMDLVGMNWLTDFLLVFYWINCMQSCQNIIIEHGRYECSV